MSDSTVEITNVSSNAPAWQETERLMRMYCDLTWAQYSDLLEISAGRLTRMNGARRQTLGELLDEHLLLTWAGHRALNRAIGLVEGTWTPVVREEQIQNPTLVAMLARGHYDGGHWIHSVHVKTLNALWHRPGLAYRYVRSIFSYQTVDELMERQLVTGRAVLGSAFRLSAEGERFVYWAFRTEAAVTPSPCPLPKGEG
jgi:hypothetical protein